MKPAASRMLTHSKRDIRGDDGDIGIVTDKTGGRKCQWCQYRS
jgi:hypothetical protein